MKKLVEDLGLPVIRIDVCSDGCMLYWGVDIDKQSCRFCNLSRFKDNSRKTKPHKQLFYLPLAPMLQRLYASNMTAAHMTWHGGHVNKLGIMCHPSNGEALKRFDHHYPIFALEQRNVRLGLCSDGFAPFGQFGKSYSCWPVILTPYNLPPGMCMKSPYMFISLIIPGPKSPQRNIDIFLQPLIEELQMLWNVGVPTYDVSRDETFNMKAMLLWTISDFPAYRMLSGWSTHGLDGCPIYNFCRRIILTEMKDRVEKTLHPHIKDGNEIWSEFSHYKLASESPNDYPHGFSDHHKWTKRSIFWELPYWSKLLIRHNLDFMHIEKNVFENIINTIMNVKAKTNDNLNARKNMFLVCNRLELHVDLDTLSRKPKKASYTLTREENILICKWLKTLKFPDGYVSNLSRCVDTTESRFLKSVKNKMKSKARIETSICNAYILEEISTFASYYFESNVLQEQRRDQLDKELTYFISFGPKTPASRYSTYFFNGYVWRAGDFGSNKSTMNSGICVHANDSDYYGLLEEIIELEYYGPCLHVVLFKCFWFDPIRGTRVNETYRLIDVNMRHIYTKYDPFVLAQLAIQVYYSNYPTTTNDRDSGWMAVCKTKVRENIEKIWTNEVVYQQEYPTIELYIALHIPLHDVNDLSDPNVIHGELDGFDETELIESASEESDHLQTDSNNSTNGDDEDLEGEEQSGDDIF
ncbi:uncharacterized protein LOC124924590 [Impatiens glandulifera]|uniref:uncharacterized protein LOC124924590 n=1 Tax=Impatiens glandulifera TaxID=253017 RepID=UPI001FB0F58D|nr:uncharacterized protein LOC124924590 [Impatiens glandulifera]